MIGALVAILLVPVAIVAATFVFAWSLDPDQARQLSDRLRQLADDMQAHANWIRRGRP